MPFLSLRLQVERIFYQRCFYLFVSLVALVAFTPWAEQSNEGWLVLQGVNLLVLVAAITAVGRSTLPFIASLLMGGTALALQALVIFRIGEAQRHAVLSLWLYLAIYVLVLIYLLRYVFRRDVMTDDKFFGAASAYLLMGVGWTVAYWLVQYHDPDAFAPKHGAERTFLDLLYMSFGCLTSNGPGEIIPHGSKVRVLVILEQVAGALFLAVLIARLAGSYPGGGVRKKERESPGEA